MFRKENTQISIFISGIALFIYYFFGKEWSESGKLTNTYIYIVSAVLFFCVYMISELILGKVKIIKLSFNYIRIAGIVMALWGVYWFISSFKMELEIWPHYPASYLRHNIPEVVYLVMLLLTMVFVIVCATEKLGGGEQKIGRLSLAALIVFIQGFYLFAPNFFKDTSGGLYHIDAYTNSIVNALRLTPYASYNTAIYGHYGILYIIPVNLLKLFGLNEWIAISLSIAMIGAIIYAIEYWILSKLIKNDIIFYFSAIANTIVSFQIYNNQFYQVQPHRYVPQVIILMGCLFALKYKEKRWCHKVMWGITILAVVWNTECGVVASTVWMLCSIYIDASIAKKYSIRIIAKNVLLLIGSVLGSYLFVNLYNLLVGGNVISFGTYIYPIGSNSYPIENIQVPLQTPWAGYFLAIILLLGIVVYFFKEVLFLNGNYKQIFYVLSSLMGLGVYTYYMNRAVSSNASIVCFEVVVALSIICDSGLKEKYMIGKVLKNISIEKTTIYMSFIVLSSLVLASIGSVGTTLSTKISTTYEVESIETFMADMKSRLPKDTVAFGIGTSQVYSFLDIETGIYMSDWEDLDQTLNGGETVINQDAIDYLENLLRDSEFKHILVNQNQEKYIPKGYNEIDSFTYGEFVFKLYEKKRFESYVFGEAIYFYGKNHNVNKYLISGLSGAEDDFTWTDGNETLFGIHIDNAPNKVLCSIELATVFNQQQEVCILVNEQEVFREKVSIGDEISFEFENNETNDYVIKIQLPNAISPLELMQSDDSRELALAIKKMFFYES